MPDEDRDDQLEHGYVTAAFVLEHTSQKLSPEDAEREFGDVSKENFWRMWPRIRDWGEKLWELIDEERGHHASPVQDDDYGETGGGG